MPLSFPGPAYSQASRFVCFAHQALLPPPPCREASALERQGGRGGLGCRGRRVRARPSTRDGNGLEDKARVAASLLASRTQGEGCLEAIKQLEIGQGQDQARRVAERLYRVRQLEIGGRDLSMTNAVASASGTSDRSGNRRPFRTYGVARRNSGRRMRSSSSSAVSSGGSRTSLLFPVGACSSSRMWHLPRATDLELEAPGPMQQEKLERGKPVQFRHQEQQQPQQPQQPQHSTHLNASEIDAAVLLGNPKALLKLVKGMMGGGVRLSSEDIVRCATLCSKAGMAHEVEGLLRDVLRAGYRQEGEEDPRPALYQAAILAFTRINNRRKALALLREARDAGLPPMGMAYESVIKEMVKASNREVTEAKGLLTELRERGVTPTKKCYTAVVKAMYKRGRLQDVMMVFDWLIKDVPNPGRGLYNIAILACEEDASRALDVLDMIREGGGGGADEVSYNAAMRACAREGRVDDALALLKDMWDTPDLADAKESAPAAAGTLAEVTKITKPTVVTYNAAMNACVRGGQTQKALDLLREMASRGLSTDAVSYGTVIHGLAESLLAERRKAARKERQGKGDGHGHKDKCEALCDKGLALLQEMKDAGPAGPRPNSYCYNAVLRLCGLSHRVDDVATVFEQAQADGAKVAVEALNPGLHALLEGHRPEDVLKLVTLMGQSSLAFDGSTYDCAVAALACLGRPLDAAAMVNRKAARGLKLTVVNYNTLLQAFISAGQPQQALDVVLHEMTSRGVSMDVYSYGHAIHACALLGDANRALALLDDMEATGVTPNLVVYGTAMDACARAGKPTLALSLLEEMLEAGLTPDVYCYGTAINACAVSGDETLATTLLAGMQREGVTPNNHCYSAALRSFAFSKRTDRSSDRNAAAALDFLKSLDEAGVEPKEICFNVAMDSCAECGDFTAAFSLLTEMFHRGLEPTDASYGAALKACAKAADAERALELLGNMRRLGKEPQVWHFNTVIDACAQKVRVSQPEDVRKKYSVRASLLLGEMHDAGLSPDQFSFCAAMNASAWAREHDKAFLIFEAMKVARVLPNAACYRSALAMCAKASEADKASAIMEEMKTDGLVPDPYCYKAAIRACWRGGLIKAAYELETEMEEVWQETFGQQDLD